MKAWQVHAWGEPETMVLADVPLPEPGPGQLRIRNHAAALNFLDILQVQGKYQSKPPFPFTPGAEVAGTVDAIGDGVTSFRLGDRVVAMPRGSGFAEYCLSDTASVFPIPEGLGFAEAAAMPIVYHTGWFAFRHRTMLQTAEWLLVHAGASGVGMAAIQIGRALGASIIATAGSREKLDFARAQGAHQALDYSDESWVDRVKEITGTHGANVIYDPVGGDVFELSTKCIAPEGRLLVIGFASGRIPSIQTNRVLLKNISVIGVAWGGYVQSHPAYPARTQEALNKVYAEGKIKPVVSSRYPLDAAPRALRDLANRKVLGKAALVID